MPIKKPSISTTHRLTQHTRLWGRHSPIYIVIHFTGGFGDSISSMLSCYNDFVKAGSNAHYLVGRNDIWELVNPKLFYCTYSCGSSVGKKNECRIIGWGPETYKGSLSMSHAAIAGHSNTINIEICSCKSGRRKSDPMDDGWYFNNGTYTNAVNLCAWLCDELGLKVSNIIMHNQVTGKICPAMWCNRDGAESGFIKFKEDVASVLNEIQDTEIATPSPKPPNGIIMIPKDSIFYSRPTIESAIVYMATTDTSLEYTMSSGTFYYTEFGWIPL